MDLASSFGIARQVQHKIDFVERERRARPEAILMLAGHSVGAYICLQVLLFPFCGALNN